MAATSYHPTLACPQTGVSSLVKTELLSFCAKKSGATNLLPDSLRLTRASLPLSSPAGNANHTYTRTYVFKCCILLIAVVE